MRRKFKTRKKQKRIAAAALVMLAILSAAFFQNYARNFSDFGMPKNFQFFVHFLKSAEPSDEQIITRISKFDLPEGAPWITKIENAEEQAKLYPALFSGTKDGQYALRYATLLAVYDYQEDKIIRRVPISDKH